MGAKAAGSAMGRSPWLCLPLASESKEAPAPSWWQPALEGPGLVIKPLAGHACRGVVRYRIRDGQLLSEPLFRAARAQPTPPPPAAACSPDQLHGHWQALQGQPEAAIAMPYLLQAPSLPATEPALVMRVITRMAFPGAALAVQEAWLELPLPANPAERRPGQLTAGPSATICQSHGEKSRLFANMRESGRMRRYLEPRLLKDLAGKTVVLTGARQVGKTTLARQLMERIKRAQYLNWDVPVDRAVLLRQSWNPAATLLVLDEIQKCPPENLGSRA